MKVNSQVRRPLRIGKELGVGLVQLLRKQPAAREARAGPLVLTPDPVLFLLLCPITPASWAEAAAPSKMSHHL